MPAPLSHHLHLAFRYFLEYMLSVDNLFVFQLVFKARFARDATLLPVFVALNFKHLPGEPIQRCLNETHGNHNFPMKS